MATLEIKKSKSILDSDPKGNLKQTALKTLAEVGVSVIGGGLIGSALGKPSFLIGLALAGVGYYKGVSWLAPLGLGMMSTSHLISEKSNGVSGFDFKTETANAKDRVLSFKDSLLQKTYLDKFIPSKKSSNARHQSEDGTEGFGSLEANLSALDDIENQLEMSANAFYKRRGNPADKSFETPVEGGTDEPDFSGM